MTRLQPHPAVFLFSCEPVWPSGGGLDRRGSALKTGEQCPARVAIAQARGLGPAHKVLLRRLQLSTSFPVESMVCWPSARSCSSVLSLLRAPTWSNLIG